jgi:hypothetical protein
MASPLDALPPPAAAANPLDALPPPANLYPGLSSIPGFSYVKPFFDVAAGAGSGAVQTAAGVYDLLRKIPGADSILPDSAAFHQAIQANTPDTMPAHIGRFLEGLTEYAIPAGKAAEATRGMGLGARALAQAGVGAGVSAAQTGGDPGSVLAGAALGAGGETAADIARGAKALVAAKAPTLANFAESFGGATPTQKAKITRALATLAKDGITPPDTVHEMQDIVKTKLADLADAYRNIDPAVKMREIDPADVVAELRDVQDQYTRRGVVTDQKAFDTIEKEIRKVQDIAMKNGGQPALPPSGLVGPTGQPLRSSSVAIPGKVNVDDIVHLKQLANGRTNWQSPRVEQTLWNNIGDAYRNAADTLAPEVTPINRDYQTYKDLEQMIDQNIARGKGVAPTGLDILLKRAAAHGTGAAVGGTLGGAVAGPLGATVGAIAGGAAGPKIAKAAQQAIQNAVDSGAFARLPPVRQGLLRTMQAMGDNAGILKLLGTSATEELAAGR